MNFEKYATSGYFVGNKIIDNNQIVNLRNLILKNFKQNKMDKELQFVHFDADLRSCIIKLFTSNIIKEFLINNSSLTDVAIIPIIQVMKNYHVNRIKTPGIGWHRDCGGEFNYKYSNSLLSDKKYIFGKIGIYLQENSSNLGGGIDLIPKSHFYIKNKNYLKRKINGIFLKVLQLFQKYLPNIYKLIPEKIYLMFLKAIKIKAEPGCPVFFDSRIIHRGTPINDFLINSLKEIDNIHYEIPDNNAKITIYCQFGSSTAISSYLYDRVRRNSKSDILKNWFEEIELYKEFSSELYNSAINIMKNVELKELI